MSAYVNDEGEFVKFFGTTIMAGIKNKQDLLPIMSVLKRIPDVKIVSDLHLKICDVFSQTLASFNSDSCLAIDKWFKENHRTYTPYSLLDCKAILTYHYEAKEVIKAIFPQDFEISYKTCIQIRNNKIVLHFEFIKDHENRFKEIVKSCNKIYGIRRGLTKYIVLGYIRRTPFEFNKEQLNLLNSLIPRKIYINYPDVYHYSTIDRYHLYSEALY